MECSSFLNLLGTAAVSITSAYLATYVFSPFLKHKDLQFSFKKVKIEKLIELYELIVLLQEENRKLFQYRNIEQKTLKNHFNKWISTFVAFKTKYLVCKIILNDQVISKLDSCLEILLPLAMEIQNHKNDLSSSSGQQQYYSEYEELKETKEIIDKIESRNDKPFVEATLNSILLDLRAEYSSLMIFEQNP